MMRSLIFHLVFLLIPFLVQMELQALTLQEAVHRAGLSAYELQIREQEIKIKEGEVWQASLLPNPALEVSYDGLWRKGESFRRENAVASYEVQTLWELGGKRGERTLAACMDKLLSEWDYEEARIALLTELKIAFIDAFVAQEKLRIGRKYLKISRKAYDASTELLQRGRESKSNHSRAKLSLLQAGVEVERQEREYQQKRSKVAGFWNACCPDFECLEFELEAFPCVASLCKYEERLQGYPGLVRQKLRVNRAEREVKLQKAYAWPDVLVSLGVDQEVRRGDYGVRVEVNFPLPVFNTNQGKIYAARQQVIQRDLEAKEYYLNLVLELRRIYGNMEQAQMEAEWYRREIVPELEEAHWGAVETYGEGKMELIQFLENEKFYLDTQSAFLETLGTFHKFYAELCQYIRGIS